MPVVFEQPGPLDPATSEAYGRAEAEQKLAPLRLQAQHQAAQHSEAAARLALAQQAQAQEAYEFEAKQGLSREHQANQFAENAAAFEREMYGARQRLSWAEENRLNQLRDSEDFIMNSQDLDDDQKRELIFQARGMRGPLEQRAAAARVDAQQLYLDQARDEMAHRTTMSAMVSGLEGFQEGRPYRLDQNGNRVDYTYGPRGWEAVPSLSPEDTSRLRALYGGAVPQEIANEVRERFINEAIAQGAPPDQVRQPGYLEQFRGIRGRQEIDQAISREMQFRYSDAANAWNADREQRSFERHSTEVDRQLTAFQRPLTADETARNVVRTPPAWAQRVGPTPRFGEPLNDQEILVAREREIRRRVDLDRRSNNALRAAEAVRMRGSPQPTGGTGASPPAGVAGAPPLDQDISEVLGRPPALAPGLTSEQQARETEWRRVTRERALESLMFASSGQPAMGLPLPGGRQRIRSREEAEDWLRTHPEYLNRFRQR